jgi:hypothetical protein
MGAAFSRRRVEAARFIALMSGEHAPPRGREGYPLWAEKGHYGDSPPIGVISVSVLGRIGNFRVSIRCR